MATFLEKDNREVLIMSKINEVAELVEKGKAKLVGPAVQEAIDEGCLLYTSDAADDLLLV